MSESGLATISAEISSCHACPRLVAYRERIAREKILRFRNEEYWGRPVPGFGSSEARLWILGLAPAAHGGNRTGRVFTGDKSGDFLFRSLFEAGFCNQPTSSTKNDGLALHDLYLSAVVRCAPPDNKPDPSEFDNCRPFLLREFLALPRLSLVLVLGALAYREYAKMISDIQTPDRKWPPFFHGLFIPGEQDRPSLLASYHPSARNTQTGRLTSAMMSEILVRARRVLSETPPRKQDGSD
jgi:uracil-DNA glycosylase family 4